MSIINLQNILDIAEDMEALKPTGIDGDADGYDKAIVGITDDGQLVYSKEKMVQITAKFMEEEEAIEWLEFNTFGAYVGEKTPLYISTGI